MTSINPDFAPANRRDAAPIVGEIHFGTLGLDEVKIRDLGLGWIRLEYDPNARHGVLDLPAEGLVPLAKMIQELEQKWRARTSAAS